MSNNITTNINEWVEVDEDQDWSDWVVLISTLEKDEIERRLALIEVRINLIKKFKKKRVNGVTDTLGVLARRGGRVYIIINYKSNYVL